jgi:hypothetical protein
LPDQEGWRGLKVDPADNCFHKRSSLKSTCRTGRRGGSQVIHHDFGRAQNLRPAPVTTLKHIKNRVVCLGRIMPLGNGFMLMRIKRLADNLIAYNPVPAEQQTQLLQGHFHPLAKLLGTGGCTGGQRPFEIVNHGQQLGNEGFLLGRSPALTFPPAAPPEILKVRRQSQMHILLLGEFLFERVRLGGGGQRWWSLIIHNVNWGQWGRHVSPLPGHSSILLAGFTRSLPHLIMLRAGHAFLGEIGIVTAPLLILILAG